MSSQTHVQKITIFGASGNIGVFIVPALLSSTSPKFEITAVARQDSAATFPQASNLTVLRGSLDDRSFIDSAVHNADVVLLLLPFTAGDATSRLIISASAAAGVKFIIPSEFGHDTTRADIAELIPSIKHKPELRAAIEAAGLSWIGIATSLWLEFNLERTFGGLDVKKRTAELWKSADGQDAVASFTTEDTVALSVLKVLQKPVETLEKEYKNRMLFVRDFQVSQRDILHAVQDIVGKEGWTVTEGSVQEHLEEGQRRWQAGDLSSVVMKIYGSAFHEISTFSGPLANAELGLPNKTLRESVKTWAEGAGKAFIG